MREPHEHDPLRRFSNRVADYTRFRPGYPREMIVWLRDAIDLRPSWIVADIGSGTGLLAQEFCEHGNLVYAVEPNDAMRAAAEEIFEREPHFVSVTGSAEDTTLPDGAVDLVAAGQAFHWFDQQAARHEWKRILSPGGRAMIVFNSRRIETTAFMQAYDEFLVNSAIDYQGVDHRRVLGENLRAFLGEMLEWRFNFLRTMTCEELLGLSMSSSYVPAPGQASHASFVEGLRALFDQYAVDGTIDMLYQTEAYVGRL